MKITVAVLLIFILFLFSCNTTRETSCTLMLSYTYGPVPPQRVYIVEDSIPVNRQLSDSLKRVRPRFLGQDETSLPRRPIKVLGVEEH